MFSNRLEMLIESFLGRLVIKRTNNKNAVGADFFSKFVHVEGLGTDLYPQLDIWKLAKPILTEWVKANMNPVKNFKEIGQQIPDLLLGAQDLPSLLIDSLNGLKNQSAWHDKQLKEIQQMRLQMQQQQRRSWMFGSTMLILLTIAIITPWFVSIVLIVLSSLLALWRIMK